MKETSIMTIQNIFSYLLLGLMVALLALGSALSTTAQTQQERVEIGFSPIVIEFSANPGEVVENNIRIDNLSGEALIFETIPKNLTPSGEEGQVVLTEDSTSYSLADWITTSPAQTPIEGGSSFNFKTTVSVPENAEPGGHFGAVVFKTIPPDPGQGNAAVSQEVAPLLLVSVAGAVEESAEVASFESLKSLWSNETPKVIVTRIQNNGSVHIRPRGNITIKNMFGNEVASIPIAGERVLPDSIRRIETEWETGFTVGRYSADLTAVYGNDDQLLTASTTFVVFPYQTIIPAAILIIGLLFVLIKFRKRIGAAGRALSGKN